MKICAICMGLLLFVCGPVFGVFESFPVCNFSDSQQNPSLDGHIAVWEDRRGGNYNIYYRYLGDVNDYPVYSSLSVQSSPDIDRAIVVWEEQGDIIGYDLANDVRIEICVDANVQTLPAISGDIVVWQENYQIWGCNINDLVKFRVHSDSEMQFRPDIDGDVVVWFQGSSNYDIYGKNLDTGQFYEICTAGGEQYNPAISDDVVVWTDSRNYDPNKQDIYGRYLDGVDDFPICQAAETQTSPSVSGNIVAWKDKRNGNYQIFYCDLSQSGYPEYLVTANSNIQDNPVVDNYTIIWENSTLEDIEGCFVGSLSLINVLAPQSGDMVPAGSQVNITWQSSAQNEGVVKIEFSENGGVLFETIVLSALNTGSYSLSIPEEIDSDQCIIKVLDAGDQAVFGSVGPFTIAPCSENLTADLNGDCEVDLLDYGIFCGQWLDCGNPYDQNCIE